MAGMRYDMTFRGRVQGVGFRATTVTIARRFAVTGWVRNEPDGSVRCLAEGEKHDLEQFVRAIQDAMPGYVTDTVIDKTQTTGEFDGFAVRY